MRRIQILLIILAFFTLTTSVFGQDVNQISFVSDPSVPQMKVSLQNTSQDLMIVNDVKVNDVTIPPGLAGERGWACYLIKEAARTISKEIPSGGTAEIIINYPWLPGNAYQITVITSLGEFRFQGQAPKIEVISPQDGSTLSGITEIKAKIIDGGTPYRIDVYIDDEHIGRMEQKNEEWTLEWNTFKVSNGNHLLKISAKYGPNSKEIYQIQVKVENSEILRTFIVFLDYWWAIPPIVCAALLGVIYIRYESYIREATLREENLKPILDKIKSENVPLARIETTADTEIARIYVVESLDEIIETAKYLKKPLLLVEKDLTLTVLDGLVSYVYKLKPPKLSRKEILSYALKLRG